MEHTTRTLSTTLLVLALAHIPSAGASSLPPSPDPTAQPTEASSEFETEAATPEQQAIATWAVERFEEAGLALPSLTVSFHKDKAECDGYVGVVHTEGERFIVRTCALGTGLRHNLLHELAHVWDLSGGITEDSRQAFLRLRGLSGWQDLNEEWSQRGIEQAAEIVAWGLEVAQWDIPTDVADVGTQDADSLRQAFELLTGRLPIWWHSE